MPLLATERMEREFWVSSENKKGYWLIIAIYTDIFLEAKKEGERLSFSALMPNRANRESNYLAADSINKL